MCAIGLLIGVCLIGNPRHRRWIAAVTAWGMPFLALCLYFTFSRGAVVSFLVGFVVTAGLASHRRQVLAAALWLGALCAIPILLASRSEALTIAPLPMASTAESRQLALVLVAVAAVGALVASLFSTVRQTPAGARRIGEFGLGGASFVLITTTAWAVHRFGQPLRWPVQVYDSFVSSPQLGNYNLNQRLLELSSTFRTDLWSVGWKMFVHHPLTGGGGGTFERHWYENRPVAVDTGWPHSLYIGMLGELGMAGLCLVLIGFGPSLLAGFRAKDRSAIPGLVGALAAYLVHTGVDWDWQLPAVTVAALLVMGGLLATTPVRLSPSQPTTQAIALGAISLILVVSAVTLKGNLAIAATQRAVPNLKSTQRLANEADTWAPWSPLPWLAVGTAAGTRHPLVAREAYQRAIRSSPLDWRAWLGLASIAAGEQQRIALRRALSLNPLGRQLDTLCLAPNLRNYCGAVRRDVGPARPE